MTTPASSSGQSHRPAGRTIVVTGAASGIGAAIARQLAGPQTRLVLHTRGASDASQARLAEVRHACESLGAQCAVWFGDLTEPSAAAHLIDAAHDAFGPVDQLVSNAGFATRQSLADVDDDAFARTLAAMPGAFAALLRSTLPDLQGSPQAGVVAVSSFVAHRFAPNQPGFPATAAAKAAIEALAKSAAAEYARSGVTINCVAPGYTRKDGGHSAIDPAAWQRAADATPTGRLCEPDDIAALAVFLLGPHARQITGQVIHVDGGLTL
ncbi:SDR family NAD(P)-dependent oxidoreductase [Pandoraea apista]|uniref:SDR family oxidoreductase n=1 Tax=Pandoraea apista TaxID=93218 RepID=A0ABX9ZUG5_9BURK|nr:SDR family oxidoreductase [Pandoraea apista]AJF00807.2 short-chain dehydrogenase [Pandoraea apista]AKH71990.1 short-chain dehydrogenase [Pandoraea apista]AKI64265.1 short-chain dehydrogenase [Pandoraea apista]ALS66546.1 short-chain dehydrogenase [Pandoraea apista]OXS94649.1 short-chain dehydrogenase [Pandoraea apista]